MKLLKTTNSDNNNNNTKNLGSRGSKDEAKQISRNGSEVNDLYKQINTTRMCTRSNKEGIHKPKQPYIGEAKKHYRRDGTNEKRQWKIH